MKLSNKIFNENSDDDLEEEDEGEEEEQSQDDGDDYDDEEVEKEDEGEEVGDDEDFVEENENVAPNVINKKDANLGGGNKKIVLKKTFSKKPTTQKLVDEAINELNERAGSSTEAIKKYIMSKHPDFDEKRLRRQMKRHIKNCITDGTMMQIKRSFKLTNKHELKKKQTAKKKEKAKKDKLKEKEKVGKENKKEKKSEEKTKAINTEKTNEKSKDKTKTTKRTKAEANDDAKTKTTKKPKLEKVDKMPDSLTTKGKTEKSKSKKKLARKSINLVVRPTPPRPKTMKRTKPNAVAEKKKNGFKETESAASKAAPATVKATSKGKKK